MSKKLPKELPSLLKLQGNQISGIETQDYDLSAGVIGPWWVAWRGSASNELLEMLETHHGGWARETSRYKFRNWQWTMLGEGWVSQKIYKGKFRLRKLTLEKAREIRELYAYGSSVKGLAVANSVSVSTIRKVLRGEIYKES